MEQSASNVQKKPLLIDQYIRHKGSKVLCRVIRNETTDGFVVVEHALKGTILRNGLGIDMNKHKSSDFELINHSELHIVLDEETKKQ